METFKKYYTYGTRMFGLIFFTTALALIYQGGDSTSLLLTLGYTGKVLAVLVCIPLSAYLAREVEKVAESEYIFVKAIGAIMLTVMMMMILLAFGMFMGINQWAYAHADQEAFFHLYGLKASIWIILGVAATAYIYKKKVDISLVYL